MTDLPYAPVYLNDLHGLCVAHGLRAKEQGVLFGLLWAQHMAGSIPAHIPDLRPLVAPDATPGEIQRVVGLFFPLCEDGRRRNAQQAAAREKSVALYEAQVRGGQMRAAQMWAGHSSACSSASSSADRSANSSPYSNQNQNQNENQNSTKASRGKKKRTPPPTSVLPSPERQPLPDRRRDDDDEIPF